MQPRYLRPVTVNISGSAVVKLISHAVIYLSPVLREIKCLRLDVIKYSFFCQPTFSVTVLSATTRSIFILVCLPLLRLHAIWMGIMPWQPAITIPTFICSVLSSVATATVLFMWMISNDPAKKRSSRYALVINLTLAGEKLRDIVIQRVRATDLMFAVYTEFINSTNNTISGGWVLSHRTLLPTGPSCNFNGWLGQVSVQVSIIGHK